eukprot:GHVU01105468.1.p1 GENE.GHVU01105468.1~~GHVU01105468.1.p1  ORF type:complete len:121 (+),score=15.34 GHVU01105468.1:644-1006(+)
MDPLTRVSIHRTCERLSNKRRNIRNDGGGSRGSPTTPADGSRRADGEEVLELAALLVADGRVRVAVLRGQRLPHLPPGARRHRRPRSRLPAACPQRRGAHPITNKRRAVKQRVDESDRNE